MRPIVLLLLLALPRLSVAQDTPALDELAKVFAGANQSPVCRVAPQASSAAQTSRDCAWVLKATARPETMTVTRHAGEGSVLTWDHVVEPGDGTRAFLDSISGFGKARKLVVRDCGRSNGTSGGEAYGMLWTNAEFVLFVTHFTPSEAPHRVLVMATDAPQGFPEALMCPRNPQ